MCHYVLNTFRELAVRFLLLRVQPEGPGVAMYWSARSFAALRMTTENHCRLERTETIVALSAAQDLSPEASCSRCHPERSEGSRYLRVRDDTPQAWPSTARGRSQRV